jgi:hypothetical protein
MTAPHHSLIEALEAADMLEIDGLHAWQFSLDKELLAQVAAGSAAADSAAQPLLSIECIDGRAHRNWRFSLGEVHAAQYHSDDNCWQLKAAAEEHQLRCYDAIRGDNEDDGEAPVDE